jgi:ribonuclease HII
MARPSSLGYLDRRLLKDSDEIIGIDEVGRGCLAGPVTVCGVSFKRIPRYPLVRDSKAMSPIQRQQAAGWILEHCETWLLTEVWPELIDRINILEATRLAVRSIARTLGTPNAVTVVDQIDPGDVGCAVHAVPRADATYFAVASASIVAKVHRDSVMSDLARKYPDWAWSDNKGYGTKQHRLALQQHGRTFLHRNSFSWSPVLP